MKMKTMLLFLMAAASAASFAKDPAKKDPYDIRPPVENVSGAPTAVAWQDANKAALAASVSDAALAAFVADEQAAKALLAQVGSAYKTDPTVATQIAAVSQWVMLKDADADGPHAKGRKVWTKALCAAIRGATDDYVKTFCLDQLRWCGCPCGAKCVSALAAQEKSKSVKDFAELVARELQSAKK